MPEISTWISPSRGLNHTCRIATESVSKTTFIDFTYKRIHRFPQTFPEMGFKSSDRPINAVVNPEFPSILIDVNVSSIMVRLGELQNVAANFSSHS